MAAAARGADAAGEGGEDVAVRVVPAEAEEEAEGDDEDDFACVCRWVYERVGERAYAQGEEGGEGPGRGRVNRWRDATARDESTHENRR